MRKVEECEKKGGYGYDQPVDGFFVFMNVYNHLTFWSPPGDILQRQVPSAHSLQDVPDKTMLQYMFNVKGSCMEVRCATYPGEDWKQAFLARSLSIAFMSMKVTVDSGNKREEASFKYQHTGSCNTSQHRYVSTQLH